MPNGNHIFTKKRHFPYFWAKTPCFKSQTATASPVHNTGKSTCDLKIVAVWQLITQVKSLALIIMLDPEVTITHIRENIRQKIQDAGYATIEKFAYENRLTKSTITRAINGSRNPRLVTLIEIANALSINLSELLDLCHIEQPQARKTKPSSRSK
ncbi:helix-turn-helix transcriptional regulator [Candidatus Saccharibacteria bacterium]|nr:helix-turn-helix transcriptional regulator [Candidatus Saccharibacteria bacterium]